MRPSLCAIAILIASCSAKTTAVAPNAPLATASSIEDTVRAMANMRRARAPSFSPDGERLAFISDASGKPEIYVMAALGGVPERVSAFEDPVSSVAWSPDGAHLAISIAPGGGMNQQIYLARSDGKDPELITGGGKDNNWPGDFSLDGRLFTLASNRRDPAAMDAYLYDLEAKKLTLVSENSGIGFFTDVSLDRRRALLLRMKDRGNNDLYLVDLEKKTEQLITAHEGPGTFWGLFSPDGKSIYLLSNKERDLTAFARSRIDSNGTPGPIELLRERADAELNTFAIGDHGVAALVWNAGGKSELELFDLASSKPLPTPPLPRELLYFPTFSRDGRRFAATLTGPAAPPDIWLLESGAWRKLTHSAHERVDLDALVRPELVKFSAHDGLELSGWLYRPKDAVGRGSVVISFHGGPEGQETPTLRSDYQALLARGIGVLAPNVRGSSGFGKKFVNLDNGALRTNAVKDIKSCVDYLVAAKIADPKRIGIMGGSYGGYMTMAGLTEYPDSFAAGANLFGIVNFATFFEHTEPWMAAISKVEYGDPVREREMLKALSPIHKLDRIVAPVIVLHGKNDTNVPVVEAEQVVDDLKRRGVPVAYVLFPDEGHGWLKTENRIRSTLEITRWFDQHLNREALVDRSE
jgi:dipeptidyl aminopeptidase/acylaminoacyl peptidase